MDPRDRVVVAMPVQAPWTDKGELSAVRSRDLDGEAIRELLRRGPLRFVVADCGCRLRWIPPMERFAFWKADVTTHLWDAERRHLGDYPDGFAYFASEWIVPGMELIVLLEKHH